MGETFLLTCIGYSLFDTEIRWSFNNDIVGNTSLVTAYTEKLDQGGKVFTQSLLQVCGAIVSDSGDYTCIVSNGQSTTNDTIQVIVSSKFGQYWVGGRLTCLFNDLH